MSQHSEHSDEINELNSNDDTQSIKSNVSMERATIECPECKKDLQARTMFKHIRNYHPQFFESRSAVYSLEDFDNLIKYSTVYPLDWEVTNDFDEVEARSIFGCLGCNSAFINEKKGNTHCKSAKCKKEHIKGIKEYKKLHIKEAEKTNKKHEADKIVPTYSKDKWTTEIQKAITSYTYYYTKLDKIINLIKKNGDDVMFINKTIQLPANVGKWEWRDINYFDLHTINYSGELPIEYTKVCLLIIELHTQLRVLSEGVDRLPLHMYSDDVINSMSQHPNNTDHHWGNYCHHWIWLHYSHMCRF